MSSIGKAPTTARCMPH